jgi:Flp pilus assembly protein TadD
LLLLGKIKMSQNKFDEALDLLSRSAQVNPQSAEAQNYLGIVLSEKGQRVSAEAALRKAIQIQPDYASAHHNLAIIYATQKPPFIELARWHYDKAISLGHAKNPELEKIMAGN